MPELPEVQTVVSTIRPRLLGATLRNINVARTDICLPANTDLPSLLAGRTIADITRRAKRIIFHLDSGDRFYIHLGMTGRLLVCQGEAELVKHTHLVVDVGNRLQLRFVDPRRFGGIFWLGRESHELDLGPEPLGLRASTLAERLRRTRRPLKSALLDQSLIAGLGNIYVDESLFLAGIHPLTRSDRLKPELISALTKSIKLVLKRAIKAGGSSIRDYVNGDGVAGEFQLRHNVYDRKDQPCRKCKTPIKRIVLGERSTHFCPACQRRS